MLFHKDMIIFANVNGSNDTIPFEKKNPTRTKPVKKSEFDLLALQVPHQDRF